MKKKLKFMNISTSKAELFSKFQYVSENTLSKSTTAWIVLIMSLILTVSAWFISNKFVEQRALDRFTFQIDDLQVAIQLGMLHYENVLKGGIGLISSSDHITRIDWSVYVSNLDINKYYPGIQGIGFTKWILRKDKSTYESSVRNEGFLNFKIQPEHDREEFSSIHFLEPFDWRNKRAFGYDMFSEPTRRAAMSMARDSGRAAVSGKVILVQETEENVQNGFLMYLPLYRKGEKIDTIVQRQKALDGFVYSPFRMGDLIQGILGSNFSQLSFKLYDGEKISSETLFYSSEIEDSSNKRPHNSISAVNTRMSSTRILNIGDRVWSLSVTSEDGFISEADSFMPLIVAISGGVISIMLFIIIASISRQREWAIAMAIEMTADLKKFLLVIEQSPVSVLITDIDGAIEYTNPKFSEVTGYSAKEVIGKNPRFLQSGKTIKETYQQLWGSILSGNNWYGELQNKRKDDSFFWENISISPIKLSNGTISHFIAIKEDITERKDAEVMINKSLKEKQVLLQEVHHRVKNNLQVISSMLALQARVGSSKETANALKDSERRIRVMAKVHENLCRSDDLSHIDAHSYIKSIIEDIRESQLNAGENIVFVDDIEQIILNIDMAIPLGQIISELLSNSLKHAFPLKKTGVVNISFKKMDDENVELVVIDNGVGLSKDFNISSNTSLGLQLVDTMTMMIGGELIVEGSPGASFKIVLKVNT